MIVHPRKQFSSCSDSGLAYLKEHRGRYTNHQSESFWTRIGNAISEIVQMVLKVPVEDLRPKRQYVQMTSAAVNDIRFCKLLFNEWMTMLDKCVANRFS
jgi:hypothetical protein